MSDVFTRLAKKLDKLPQGFPPTESGVELRILRKIFSPEDAETALSLKAIPEKAERIARRLGKSVEETRSVLEEMANKGQIVAMQWRGARRYSLAPFIVGIFEFQLPYIDRELAELCEEYAPFLAKRIGGSEPEFPPEPFSDGAKVCASGDEPWRSREALSLLASSGRLLGANARSGLPSYSICSAIQRSTSSSSRSRGIAPYRRTT